MKKILITGIVLTSLLLTGCSSVTDNTFEEETIVSIDKEVSYNDELTTDDLKDDEESYGSTGALENQEFTIEEMLIYAIQDEFTAKAEYTYIVDNFDVTKPFTNIIPSEETHISLLLPMFEAYQIVVPEDTSSTHLITITSLDEAFATGVLAEELNIAMYDLFLSQDDLPDDIVDVFTKLRDASLNHLAAFQKNLDQY
ncbi:MAG: DUF2202 domain-containing protein [Firmicutes bacterium]|nr:DUF2202 domain-containing protein [Bacillota bacterium]